MSEYYTQEEINQMLENKVKIEENGTIPLNSTKVNYTTGETTFQAVPITVDTPILTSENTIGDETITVKSIITEMKNIKEMFADVVKIIDRVEYDFIVEDDQKVRYRINLITRQAEVIGWGYDEAPEDNKPDKNIRIPHLIQVTEELNETIKGPYSVIGIGKRAFANSGIKTIVFSGSLRYVDDEAFCCCRDLESMTLNSSLKKFGYRACAYTKSLKTITGIEKNNSIESFGTSAFLGSGILKIIIPRETKKLGKSVFARCEKATSIEVKSPYITEYPDAVFLGCKNVTTLTMVKGNNPQTVGKKAFSRVGCTNIRRNLVNKTYPTGSIQEVIFPESIKVIQKYALHNFGAQNIQFKSKELDIRTNGLAYCLATEIQFENDATITFGALSICYCDNLKEITLPVNSSFKLINMDIKEENNTKSYRSGMYFAFCDQLTKITHLGNFNGLNFNNGEDNDRAFWKSVYLITVTKQQENIYHPDIQIVVSEEFLSQNNISDGATLYNSHVVWKKNT